MSEQFLPQSRGAGEPAADALTRRCLAWLVLAVGMSVILATFWFQDLRWARPTPVPDRLVATARPVIEVGPLQRALVQAGDRPVLVHVFSAECPCSRFNLDHVRELQRRFGERVAFVAVLEGSEEASAVSEYRALDLGVPYVFDADGRLARALGVYATPQAVVLDASRQVVYRGNYNTSRYCVDPTTQFVRKALECLLDGTPVPEFGPSASVSWGCPIPFGDES